MKEVVSMVDEMVDEMEKTKVVKKALKKVGWLVVLKVVMMVETKVY